MPANVLTPTSSWKVLRFCDERNARTLSFDMTCEVCSCLMRRDTSLALYRAKRPTPIKSPMASNSKSDVDMTGFSTDRRSEEGLEGDCGMRRQARWQKMAPAPNATREEDVELWVLSAAERGVKCTTRPSRDKIKRPERMPTSSLVLI